MISIHTAPIAEPTVTTNKLLMLNLISILCCVRCVREYLRLDPIYDAVHSCLAMLSIIE